MNEYLLCHVYSIPSRPFFVLILLILILLS